MFFLRGYDTRLDVIEHEYIFILHLLIAGSSRAATRGRSNTGLQQYGIAATRDSGNTGLQEYGIAATRDCSNTKLRQYGFAATQQCNNMKLQRYGIAATLYRVAVTPQWSNTALHLHGMESF